MSDQTPVVPPAAPPMLPPQPPGQLPGVVFHDDAGEPRGTVRVTRNVPPKRVMVLPGHTVTYAGVSYRPGDSFLIGEGPVTDAWAFDGIVTIVDHEQVDEWNGREGEEIRAQAARHIENLHIEAAGQAHFRRYLRGDITAAEMHKEIEAARKDAPSMPEDHPGFTQYEYADGPDAEPTEHTTFRMQAAAEQQAHGVTMEEHQEMKRQQRQARGRKGGDK